MLLNASFEWSEMLWIALIGFLLVVALLFLLVFVMKVFGRCFSKINQMPEMKEELQSIPDMNEEEVAAISTALCMLLSERHDREDAVLTIMSIKRAYSPWSSKIHGLTQMPLRK